MRLLALITVSSILGFFAACEWISTDGRQFLRELRSPRR